MLKLLPRIIAENDPDFKVSDKGIVLKAIVNCYDDQGDRPQFSPIIYLLKIVDDDNKALLLDTFEKELNNNFNDLFYGELIRNKLYDYNKNGYFMQLAQSTEKSKYIGFKGMKNGNPDFKDFTMYNFSLLVYLLDIDFEREELKIFTNLGEFEKWMINPVNYDYNNFDANWLLAIGNRKFVYDRIRHIKEIEIAIEKSLIKEFNAKLAQIYYLYFKTV